MRGMSSPQASQAVSSSRLLRSPNGTQLPYPVEHCKVSSQCVPHNPTIPKKDYSQRAAKTAASPQNILNKISLQPKTRTDLMALKQLHGKIDTAAAEKCEAEARNVDGRPVLHICVLAEAVMGLAECDARAAAGEQCC